MPEFIYGMTHFCLEEKKIILLEDVYQKVNKVKFWISVMHHHIEEILQETEQPKNSPIRFLWAYFIKRL